MISKLGKRGTGDETFNEILAENASSVHLQESQQLQALTELSFDA